MCNKLLLAVEMKATSHLKIRRETELTQSFAKVAMTQKFLKNCRRCGVLGQIALKPTLHFQDYLNVSNSFVKRVRSATK